MTCVDLMLDLVSLWWPNNVSGCVFRYFAFCFAVNPGHIVKKPLLMALIHVMGTGFHISWDILAYILFVV